MLAPLAPLAPVMTMDITLLFKASVKTVKTRNKAIGIGSGKDEILRRGRTKSGFCSRARDVVTNISKLKDFLLQHRKDYVSAGSLVSCEVSRMTDSERDQIDQDAQIFMRTCSEAIRTLRHEAEKPSGSSQTKDHRGAVLDLIESYLKKLTNTANAASATTEQTKERAPDPVSAERPVDPSEDPWTGGFEDEDLSPEEIQMFEQENQRLVSEMNSLVDEVKQIEGKVVEISRLQEIFAEKVLQQETEIDNIHQLVVGATENVKEGNEDIREAIKNNAGFRVWILFFLVMCSFSLLFLDWYDG
ncbi:syntaxin-18 [Boleophthalmus pectinirostris]|uniref:syntaxin-18 n=1 Tax=Boleophthalmus pectinirostris TaxID=150288 RepID=UPI00242BB2BB|nr:syntaxin-18 [Boleophthalmus pectinirostris]